MHGVKSLQEIFFFSHTKKVTWNMKLFCSFLVHVSQRCWMVFTVIKLKKCNEATTEFLWVGNSCISNANRAGVFSCLSICHWVTDLFVYAACSSSDIPEHHSRTRHQHHHWWWYSIWSLGVLGHIDGDPCRLWHSPALLESKDIANVHWSKKYV